MKKRQKILLIADFTENSRDYAYFLESDPHYEYEVIQTATGQEGVKYYQEISPDLVLLQQPLPDYNALEFLELLKSSAKSSPYPLMILTPAESESLALEAVEKGAQDYLLLDSLTPTNFVHRVRTTLKHLEITHKSRQQPQILTIAANLPLPAYRFIYHHDGQISMPYVGEGVDILFGLSRDEIMAHPEAILGKIHPEDQVNLAAAIDRVKNSDSFDNFADFWEYRLVNDSGKTTWVRDCAKFSRNGQQDLILDGVLIDITEIKEKEAHYRRILETDQASFPEDIMLVDMGIESYLGVPLINSEGQTLGLIAVLSHSPLPEHPITVEILQIFAARATAELERQKILQELEERVKQRTEQRDKIILELNQEIEERKKIELALEEKQKFIESVADNSPNILYICDLTEKRNIYRNQQMFYMLGYTTEDMEKSGFDIINELIHPDDKNSIQSHREKLINVPDGVVLEVQYRIRHKDGKWLWVLSRDSVFKRDSKGQVSQIIGAVQDITKRRNAEQALRDSEESYRRLVELIPYGIQESDLQGTITFTNPAYDMMYGYPSGSCVGSKIWDNIVDESQKVFLREYIHTVQNEQPEFTCFFIKNYTKNNRIIDIQIDWNYKRDPQGKVIGFVSVISDITQRLQAEREIESALATERELNQLKSQFIDIASHEFRTPLTTILGSTQFILKRHAQLSQTKKLEYLQRIKDATLQMTELMEDILSISCAEANKISIRPVSINLEPFCYELIHELSLGIGAGYHYNLEFSSLPEINLDAKLLRHILSNLLGNAAKYSPKESFIDLKVDYIDDKVIFKVADSGIGISSEDQPHIFESFHRGKNVENIPGTGLGLHIVKQYVDLLNGTIEVQSQLGNGSTFLVSLPQLENISKNQ